MYRHPFKRILSRFFDLRNYLSKDVTEKIEFEKDPVVLPPCSECTSFFKAEADLKHGWHRPWVISTFFLQKQFPYKRKYTSKEAACSQ
jgi:hypothetical protein